MLSYCTGPPTITGTPDDQTVSIGDTATFTVDYMPGNSPVDVNWYKDGSPVSGDRFSINSMGTLTISNVVPADRGVYNFTVSSIGGSDSDDVRLFVRCKY